MKLIDAMSYEYGRSKIWWNINFYLKCFLLVISIIAVFVTNKVSMLIGFGTLIIPIIIFFICEKASACYNCAERIRRLLLLVDGLGIEPPKLEIAQLKVEIGSIDNQKPLYVPPYYDSPLQPGFNRLADVIAESAFFTKHLSDISAKLFGFIALFGFALIFSFMYFFIQLNISRSESALAAKIVTLMIVFFISGDFISYYKKFSNLSKSSDKILSKCDNLRNEHGNSINYDIIKIMDDYNCALIQSPPIPSIVYKLKGSSGK